MQYLYTLLLVFHILSAILGVGPVFLFNKILKRAETVEQLRYAHHIVEKLNRNANYSFGIILVTGLLMGWMNPYLFRTEWYIASLILFLSQDYMQSLRLNRFLNKCKELRRINQSRARFLQNTRCYFRENNPEIWWQTL